MTMQAEITDRKLYILYINTYSRIMEIKVLHARKSYVLLGKDLFKYF